jgi:hypothetical protein
MGQVKSLADFRRQHVVLRGGNLFSGIVDKGIDQVTVRSDNGVVVQFARDEVDFIADSIDYAADRLANRIVDDNPQTHAKMADWCLRYGALAAAQREIEWLSGREFSELELRELQRRLDRAVLPRTGNPEIATHEMPESSAPASRDLHTEHFLIREQLRTAVDSLSKESRREFTTQVHNRIVNGCTAARCHLSPSSSMRLWRNDQSPGLDSTMTQRNLLAILGQIDRQIPDNSRLLQYMTTAHGGQSAAVFEEGSPDWNIIRAWAASLVIDGVAAAESDPGVARTSWQEPVSPAETATSLSNRPPRPVDLLAGGEARGISSDPYDPEWFNRMYASNSRPGTAKGVRKPIPVAQPMPLVPAPPLEGRSDPDPTEAPAHGKTRPLPPVDDD